jgi:DNA-directed RNA polymerase beta subunit
VGRFLIDEVVFVHLSKPSQKFDLLMSLFGYCSLSGIKINPLFPLYSNMIQKLYGTAQGGCSLDNLDQPMMQEVLLPGHLYLAVLKEKLQDWLHGVKQVIEADARRDALLIDFSRGAFRCCFTA